MTAIGTSLFLTMQLLYTIIAYMSSGFTQNFRYNVFLWVFLAKFMQVCEYKLAVFTKQRTVLCSPYRCQTAVFTLWVALQAFYLIEPTVLGNMITSLMFCTPVVYMISLSKPRPKPP